MYTILNFKLYFKDYQNYQNKKKKNCEVVAAYINEFSTGYLNSSYSQTIFLYNIF